MSTKTYKITYGVTESINEFTDSFVADTMLDAINILLSDLVFEGSHLSKIHEVEVCISKLDGDEVFSKS